MSHGACTLYYHRRWEPPGEKPRRYIAVIDGSVPCHPLGAQCCSIASIGNTKPLFTRVFSTGRVRPPGVVPPGRPPAGAPQQPASDHQPSPPIGGVRGDRRRRTRCGLLAPTSLRDRGRVGDPPSAVRRRTRRRLPGGHAPAQWGGHRRRACILGDVEATGTTPALARRRAVGLPAACRPLDG
jgi:hypothetical protein